MKTKAYSPTSKKKYLVLIHPDKDLTVLPPTVSARLGPLKFTKEIELIAGKPLIALDEIAALAALNKDGYYIQGYQITTSVKEGSIPPPKGK